MKFSYAEHTFLKYCRSLLFFKDNFVYNFEDVYFGFDISISLFGSIKSETKLPFWYVIKLSKFNIEIIIFFIFLIVFPFITSLLVSSFFVKNNASAMQAIND